MRAVREKLRARRGMTLSEVLVALLILSLVTVGMASGIGASLRVYRQAGIYTVHCADGRAGVCGRYPG